MSTGAVPLSLWRIVHLFARLKIRLVRNEWRRGVGARVGLVLSWFSAVVVGLSGGAILAAVDLTDPRAVRAFTLVGAGTGLACVVLPAVALGISEVIGPDHLRPFPLSRRQQLVGLLTAAAIGPVPLTGLLVLVGAVVGIARLTAGALPTLVAGGAVVTYLGGALAASRLPSVLLSRLLNSRRGRDAALVLASLLGVVVYAFQFVVRAADRLSGPALVRVTRVVRWLPPGALGRSVGLAAAGQAALAARWLAVGVAGVAAVLVVWSAAMRRQLGLTPTPARARRSRPTEPLFDGLSSALPRTSIGAVAARELRYQWRDPRRRVQAITALVMGLVWPVVNNLQRGRGRSATVLFATAACWLVVFGATNQFGLDGRAAWFDLSSNTGPRRLFLGRNLALFVPGFLAAAIACGVLGGLTGGWSYVPAALVVSAAGMVAGLGGANLASVLAPMPVPEGSNPLSSGGPGRGCLASLLYGVALAGLTVVLAPLVIAVTVQRRSASACLVVGLVALPCAVGVWWVLTAAASRLLRTRVPEVLGAVNPR